MKRWSLVLLLGWTALAASAQTTGTPAAPPATVAAEPYSDEEFEPWVLELRRAEIIAVGAFPLAYLLAGLGYDYYYYLSNHYPTTNIPWPVGPGTSRWQVSTQPEQMKRKNLTLVGASLVTGLVLAGVDWWLGR